MAGTSGHSLSSMFIESMGERIDFLEVALEQAPAATAAAQAAAQQAASTTTSGANAVDEDRYPRCQKRFCAGIGNTGARMLRERDDRRVQEILEAKAEIAAAEEATASARRSEENAWKFAAAATQRAADAVSALERMRTAARQL